MKKNVKLGLKKHTVSRLNETAMKIVVGGTGPCSAGSLVTYSPGMCNSDACARTVDPTQVPCLTDVSYCILVSCEAHTNCAV